MGGCGQDARAVTSDAPGAPSAGCPPPGRVRGSACSPSPAPAGRRPTGKDGNPTPGEPVPAPGFPPAPLGLSPGCWPGLDVSPGFGVLSADWGCAYPSSSPPDARGAPRTRWKRPVFHMPPPGQKGLPRSKEALCSAGKPLPRAGRRPAPSTLRGAAVSPRRPRLEDRTVLGGGWRQGPVPTVLLTDRQCPGPGSPPRPGAPRRNALRGGHLALRVTVCQLLREEGVVLGGAVLPRRPVASRWHCPPSPPPRTPEPQVGPASFSRGEKWRFLPTEGGWDG